MPDFRPNPKHNSWVPTFVAAFVLLTAVSAAPAQWDIENSGTHASLRGIHSLGGGVAWASGTNGTILRTEDGGYLWQGCAIPPGAEKLDFRGIQAFDEQTAIVMSSGPGDQSRLYKTTDGCRSWKLVFTNPDKDGFFDAIHRVTARQLYVLGDPVNGSFVTFFSSDVGSTWTQTADPGLEAEKSAGAFAASNSSFGVAGADFLFATGGTARPSIYRTSVKCVGNAARGAMCPIRWEKTPVPMAGGVADAGIFSIGIHSSAGNSGKLAYTVIAVGGAYKNFAAADGTAAFSVDGGQHWTAATTPPHGYRSSVAYDPTHNTWITVGPNGTDISRDNGKNWTALKPSPNEPADADQHWNALSLPFVVGPDGRIGKLRSDALTRLPATNGPTAPH